LLDKNHKASITEAAAQLHSSNPRMLSTAIHAALRYPDAHNDRNRALATWQSLLQSNTASRCAAMENIQDLALLGSPEQQSLLPGYLDAFMSLLADASEHTSLRALQGLQQWQEAITPELAKAVTGATASDNPLLREAAVSCLHLIKDEQRNKLIINAIGDGHIRVREAGIAMLRAVSKDYNESALQWISGNQASLRAQNTLMSSLMGAHLPASTYEEIAQIKSGEILLLQDALAILEQDNETAVNSARPLLQYTLKEQLDQTIELVLLALESLYDRETIKIIHAGFTCGDSRHVANACEVLGNLVKHSSICNLCDALLRASGEDPGHWQPPFAGVDDVLQWCANHANHWLSECGKQALQPAGKFNA
jgi:predicted Fe-Mo cluster-binding NifX family protein